MADSRSGVGATNINSLNKADSEAVDEIARLKKELELLKNANPFRMAEMAIELQIERLRVVEITNARDAALQQLSDTYTSIRQKNEIIERFQSEQKDDGGPSAAVHIKCDGNHADRKILRAHIDTLETRNEALQNRVDELEGQVRQLNASKARSVDPPPCYEAETNKTALVEVEVQTDTAEENNGPCGTTDLDVVEGGFKYIPPATDDPKALLHARNAFLYDMPLSPEAPDVTLCPITVPAPFTLQEFLNGAPPSLKASFPNYRCFQDMMTSWCPDREEHGFVYTPVFKCSTSPRSTSCHRWAEVDVMNRMNKPTECFYNKENVWFYAGLYKAFRMDDLTTAEWAQLKQETKTAIVRETIAGRKNSSPQNTFETTQLYAAGALKVACVGLQCIGFNHEVYLSLLGYSRVFEENKWKALATAASAANPNHGPEASPAGTSGSPITTFPASTSPAPVPIPVHTAARTSTRHVVPRTAGYHPGPIGPIPIAMPNRRGGHGHAASVGGQMLPSYGHGLGPGSSTWNATVNSLPNPAAAKMKAANGTTTPIPVGVLTPSKSTSKVAELGEAGGKVNEGENSSKI